MAASSTNRRQRIRMRAERARSKHAFIDLGLDVAESDSSIGGGLLAGALAYRLFVLLLPLVLLLVTGLGLYAGAADESPSKVAEEAGLHGLIASHVAETASSPARWIFFLVMIPAVLYALSKLYRAVAIVHALAWRGHARGAAMSATGVALLGVALVIDLGAVGIASWIRRHSELGGLASLLVYFVVVGGTWLLVSRRLPGGDVGARALLPGALVVSAGLLLVNVFNVYVTTRLVENQANTYGVLGIAAALLFSLVLVGRVVVIAAELNATTERRRRAQRGEPLADA
jgi:uncharacterized BrkB/YihY/UPF0761 family membrane protein